MTDLYLKTKSNRNLVLPDYVQFVIDSNALRKDSEQYKNEI